MCNNILSTLFSQETIEKNVDFLYEEVLPAAAKSYESIVGSPSAVLGELMGVGETDGDADGLAEDEGVVVDSASNGPPRPVPQQRSGTSRKAYGGDENYV
jgi:hypothetical protein